MAALKSTAQTNSHTNIPAILQGEVCTQYTRCGKDTCRCRDGGLHGPYYYRVWRDGEQVRKEYVRRDVLEQTQAACDAYKALMERLRQNKLRRSLLEKSMRQEWRKTQAFVGRKSK